MLTSPSSPSLHAASPHFAPAAAYRSPCSLASASAASPFATPSPSRKIASTSNTTAAPQPGRTTNPIRVPSQQSPATFADAGTQYTPPDWPPTSSRSSLRSASALTIPSAAAAATAAQFTSPTPSNPGAQQRPEVPDPPKKVAPPNVDAASNPSSSPLVPPPEPNLRVTPVASLENAIRRPLSSEPSTDASGTSATTDSKKRARLVDSTLAASKVLPADYSQCPPKTLAAIIASMLMRLIAHNDSIPLKDGHLTRFHSRSPPGISVHDYLARLTFHGTLSPPILLSMVFFIDRLSSNYPKFIINSLTVHRFLITAATAASKGLSDSFWTNHVYARVGGVTVKELALLELELLIQCDWKIVPKPEDLVEYYRGLVRQSDEYLLEGDDGVNAPPSLLPSAAGNGAADADPEAPHPDGSAADGADDGDPMDTSAASD